MPKMKKTKVTRKFLEGLAEDIYDPQTRQYMNLCEGMLQNGPDPRDGKRTLHCGLGELYFAMTGRQPDDDGMTEEGVIDLAIERSELDPDAKNKAIAKVEKKIRKALTGVPGVHSRLIDDAIDNATDEIENDSENNVEAFRNTLDAVPDENDRHSGFQANGKPRAPSDVYRSRSCRVARKLRDAAKLLPE